MKSRQDKDTKEISCEQLQDAVSQESIESEKMKKKVYLKQWYVVSDKDREEDGKKCAFTIMATCGKKAREYFSSRFPELKVLKVVQIAESEKEASWLETHSPFYV